MGETGKFILGVTLIIILIFISGFFAGRGNALKTAAIPDLEVYINLNEALKLVESQSKLLKEVKPLMEEGFAYKETMFRIFGKNAPLLLEPGNMMLLTNKDYFPNINYDITFDVID